MTPTREVGTIADSDQPTGTPSVRVIAMPADTNPSGDIFGGWLMSQMDLAAGSVASAFVAGRVVTVAVDAMTFLRPVLVGDEVSVYAIIVSTGRTSLRLAVQAWRRPRYAARQIKVTEADFTFVAVDEQGRPRAVRVAGPEEPDSKRAS